MSTPYVFPGYPHFLDRAADKEGLPGTAGPARRITALATVADLCAQASRAEAARVVEILVQAGAIADQLATAARAARLMVHEVGVARSNPSRSLDSRPARPDRPGFKNSRGAP